MSLHAATPPGPPAQSAGKTGPKTVRSPSPDGPSWTRTSVLGAAVALICALAAVVSVAGAQDTGQKPPAALGKLALAKATMCEEIQDFEPYNPAITFSIAQGKVSCYTLFDPVPEKAEVYHQWYHRDVLSTRKRLTLKPPRWATFSTILLRQSDIGPWQVVVTDENDNVLQLLRFSVTE